MQLSLASIISGIVTIGSFMLWMGWQAAQQTSNSVQLQVGITKIERRLDNIDTANTAQRELMTDLRADHRMLGMRMGEAERMIKDLQQPRK